MLYDELLAWINEAITVPKLSPSDQNRIRQLKLQLIGNLFSEQTSEQILINVGRQLEAFICGRQPILQLVGLAINGFTIGEVCENLRKPTVATSFAQDIQSKRNQRLAKMRAIEENEQHQAEQQRQVEIANELVRQARLDVERQERQEKKQDALDKNKSHIGRWITNILADAKNISIEELAQLKQSFLLPNDFDINQIDPFGKIKKVLGYYIGLSQLIKTNGLSLKDIGELFKSSLPHGLSQKDVALLAVLGDMVKNHPLLNQLGSFAEMAEAARKAKGTSLETVSLSKVKESIAEKVAKQEEGMQLQLEHERKESFKKERQLLSSPQVVQEIEKMNQALKDYSLSQEKNIKEYLGDKYDEIARQGLFVTVGGYGFRPLHTLFEEVLNQTVRTKLDGSPVRNRDVLPARVVLNIEKYIEAEKALAELNAENKLLKERLVGVKAIVDNPQSKMKQEADYSDKKLVNMLAEGIKWLGKKLGLWQVKGEEVATNVSSTAGTLFTHIPSIEAAAPPLPNKKYK